MSDFNQILTEKKNFHRKTKKKMNRVVFALFAVFFLLHFTNAAHDNSVDIKDVFNYLQSMQFQKRGDSAFSTNGMSRHMNMMSRYGGGRWRGNVGFHG